MSLSSCPECWDTPCECGYYWKNGTNKRIAEFIATTVAYKSKTEALDIIRRATFIIIKNHKQKKDKK